VLFVILAFSWLGGNWVEGELASEFTDPLEYGPGVMMMASSLLLFVLVRSSRLSPSTVIAVGLVFQVIISFCIPISQYYGAFYELQARHLTSDVVGLSSVAIWMLFYAVVFPTRPRHALIALTLSGSAVPITIVVLAGFGNMPALEPGQFVAVFVVPYVIVIAACYVAARIIYGLGRDILRAEELGSYHLKELIGRGGMGEVWRASHNMLARPAAIKLIRGDTLDSEPGGVDTALTRFEREAQATASLQSPHTVELYDYGVSDDGSFYYVMELLDGIDLESLVERFGPLPAERVVHILRQACLSLGEAHRRGLIHRDLKPANLFLCQRAFELDFLKILDFGLVRHSALAPVSESAVTKTGLLAGTPSYMAPEMAMGSEEMDGRADIYALACVAYKLLTGRRVFEEKNVVATIFAHVNTAPQPPSNVSELRIPPELDALILACLSKDPSGRPRTAEELDRELERISLAEPWTGERAADWWRMHLSEAVSEGDPIGPPPAD
jgi:serine/threonine-protein kinase